LNAKELKIIGRGEKWKIGKMDEFDNSTMEEGKNGRLGKWKIGKMEDWKNGMME